MNITPRIGQSFFLLACFVLLAWSTGQGCGVPQLCQPNQNEMCKCPDGTSSTQTCAADGASFGACSCQGQQEVTTEPTSEPTSEKPTPDPRTEPVADIPTDAGTEPTSDEPTQPNEPTQPDEPAQPDEPQTPDDAGTQDTHRETMSDNCPAGTVMYLGQCVTAQEYCTQRFSAEEQKQMFSPFTIVQTGAGLIFCQTKIGGYYLPGNGYGRCDADGDGWITLEAYRAVTHIEAEVKANARCQLKEIEAIVYHSDVPNATPQVQLLQAKVPLLETFRNDGQGKQQEQAIYTNNQAPLPKGIGSECQDDAMCTKKLCYKGHCIEGRRFAAAEINTLTKACIAGMDLNDNQLDDASESPTDTPTPKVEFLPLLKVGYFMELQYGYYEAAYDNKGQKIPVYHIKERSRRDTGDQGLPLHCGEKTTGVTPDYWRSCALRGDQRCIDPKTQATRKGLSHCWMPNVRVGTRSLFKCVTFDTTGNNGYFAPAQYGYDANYTRSKCKAVATVSSTGTGAQDVQFACDKDDGKQTPTAGQNEVGWACVSHKNYTLAGDYLAGCIQECTEAKKNGGGIEPCGLNDVCTQNIDSYGQGVFGCFSGKNGVCSDGTTLCNWGKYGTCTSNNQPSAEVCNNKDDNCDGRVDESIAPVKCWTGTAATRNIGSCQDGIFVCNGGQQTCTNETKPGSEQCDGIDNDCNTKTDEGCPQKVEIPGGSAPYTRLDLIGEPNTSAGSNETISDAFAHCLTGEALRGVEFWVDAELGITEIKTLCGPLQVQAEKSTSPYTYAIESTAYQAFETIGYRRGSPFSTYIPVSLKCPKDMVVVGIEGEASIYIGTHHRAKYIALHCAPLVFNGTLPSAYKVEYGTKSKTTTGGVNGAMTLKKFGPFFCPPGEAGVEIWANETKRTVGASVSYVYSGISVTCRPIVLTKLP